MQECVGSLTLEGTDFPVSDASCRIHCALVFITARGTDCSLQLPCMPFGDSPSHENLPGREWRPSTADLNASDTLNEGGFVVLRDEEFVPHSALVRCVAYRAESNTLEFDLSFSGLFDGDTDFRDIRGRLECVFDSPPCPECGHPLRSAAAQQCFECGAVWR